MATSDLPQNIRGLTRVEYDKLFELGVLPGDLKCELLEGQVVLKMSPQGASHAALTRRLEAMLHPSAEAHGMMFRTGAPFLATDDSEPEPDLMLLTKEAALSKKHPDSTFLVIEVCHSSHHNDRVIKTRIYAHARVPEYWIVDVDRNTIEIYTNPRGKQYRNKRFVTEGTVAPAALPDALVDIAALFAD